MERQVLYLAAVFLLGLYDLFLLFLIILLRLFEPLSLGLHGYKSYGAPGKQGGYKYVGVGEHSGIEHFLRFSTSSSQL